MMWSSYFAFSSILLLLARADEQQLRVCVQEDVTPSSCNALERQNSPLKCERVIDSAECSIKLAEGKADFGIFLADELILAHHFYPTGLQVVGELKRRDGITDPYEFQSVAVVSKRYNPINGSFSGLIGLGLCHPGFSKSQMWNDHVLKYFEQKVMNNICRRDITSAENDIINLRDFFKKGCRPGEWVSDIQHSSELKSKYPELCELCDDKVNCKYTGDFNRHGHQGALDCLTSGRGQVAYVSLRYVKDYFTDFVCIENSEITITYKNSEQNQGSKVMTDYQYLCEDGTVTPIDSLNPCTWFKQPWNVVLAREDKAVEVLDKLEQASGSKTYFSQTWEESLNNMLFRDYSFHSYANYTSPAHYLTSKGREVDLPKSGCGKNIRWCTISDVETTKCNWTSAASRNLGIKPDISCVQAQSTFECFDKIAKDEADIISIDSNYGHLARKVYGLSPVLFTETNDEQVVVGVIRDNAQLRRITSMSDIKGSSVCFPEYGGISWLSFINMARDHRLISDSCKYPEIVAKLLNAACTPGFVEASHSLGNRKPSLATNNVGKLCDLCLTQPNGERCEASPENKFYGDKGALDCLKSGVGDIAFLEAKNIKAFINNGSIVPSDYRVFCKNGSLADDVGFDVDKTCALSVTIDSEVVARRNQTKSQLLDTTFALLKIEDWLGYRGDAERRAIRIYDSFNGTENLLFKDSTNGLVSTDSDVKSVLAYKELFKHVDECSSASSIFVSFILILASYAVIHFL